MQTLPQTTPPHAQSCGNSRTPAPAYAGMPPAGIVRWNTAGKWLADWHQLGIVECKLVPIHGTNGDPVVKAYALARLFGGIAEGVA